MTKTPPWLGRPLEEEATVDRPVLLAAEAGRRAAVLLMMEQEVHLTEEMRLSTSGPEVIFLGAASLNTGT